jgi:hypothetical protein
MNKPAINPSLIITHVFLSLMLLLGKSLVAQEGQSRESAAVDPTAAQWSFQFAGETFFGYKSDMLNSGMMRPEGRQNFLQFRLVAPITKSEKFPITLLPRLTFRYEQNAEGNWNVGGSDLFVLGILNDWGSGRWGIGPQINFPAPVGFGNPNWGLGAAAAVTQRLLDDRLFLALLLQQAWTLDESVEKTVPTALVINPVVVYQLGQGWYIGNGDFVMNYNWRNGGWLVPLGVRLGKAFVGDKSTWNAYVEYQAPVAWKSWQGPVPGHAIRVNLQFQIPVGL